MAIKYIHSIAPAEADGIVAEIYAQIKRDFGVVVEPFLLHSTLPDLLAGVWTACRETELTGIVPRSVKEIIATTVSQTNRCPYCVDAHTIMLNAIGEHKITKSLSLSTTSGIDDPKLKAISKWALSSRSQKSANILSPPFSPKEAPEIIGMAVFYHYINKMVSIFLSATPLPSNQRWLKGSLKRIAGWYFSISARRSKSQGESLTFLPASELSSDLTWAKYSPYVAKAFAQFSAVIEEIGKNALADPIRHRVKKYINAWNGEHPAMNRQWVEHALQDLDDKSKEAGRLVLISAIAPYQVDEQMIVRFRNCYPEDKTLLGALAWGSFTAAKRIGTYLYCPFSKYSST